ncbi:MAG TPA: DUF1508 domain-containing protein [Cellvibrionaceae bacterium]|nr:DUF1508 domain-containing protein [Cellvibrionaceae bacterium]HMW46766.1 DUF1508 domain-containing protein [Cellvibrionaceae bacterium]HMW72139.1 DUF1508 domain-containing protein [Cellvibrionaceae bacterium]HNG59887.1 DUF1508 domain-containing protein [Cellvibrionaceae bacterium]
MSARFLLTSDETNRFFVNLVDANGELLLIGGTHPSRDEAEAAIKEIRVGTLMSNQIGASKTPSGDTFFYIKNPGGQVIAKSQLFTSAMAFDNALHQVKDNTCIAELDDLTAQNA